MNHGKLRSVFMGTPEFSTAALRSTYESTHCLGVVTQPDRPAGRGLGVVSPPVKELAQKLELEVRQPEKASSAETLKWLRSLDLDVIVVVAYGQLLTNDLLEIPRLGCINVHASLLPRWRGAAPLQRAILEGDTTTGVTIMKIVQKLDAGPMIRKSSVPIEPTTTIKSLHDQLAQLGAEELENCLLNSSSWSLEHQDEQLVTIARKIKKEDGCIQANWTLLELDRRFRALLGWPGLYWSGETGNITKILELGESRSEMPHKIGLGIHEFEGRIWLALSDGRREIIKLQEQGRKPLTSHEWIHGWRGSAKPWPLN